MILSRIYLQNFCCFRNFELRDLHQLSIVIGENDAGKSVLLDAIELLVSDGAYDPEIHARRDLDGTLADEVVLEGTFRVEPHDTLPEEFRSGDDGQELYVRKLYSKEGDQVFVRGRGYTDERFDTFGDLNRDPQMKLLKEFGITPASREEDRFAQREELVDQDKIDYEWKVRPVAFSELSSHMPRIERISSSDYRSPDKMVQKTLKQVTANVVKPKNDEGIPTEREDLRPIRQDIQDRLEAEIQKAEDALRMQHPSIQDLGVTTVIDFTNVVRDVSITIDLGEGEKLLRSFGDGTKKRVWMGLLEWDKEAAHESATGSVIRLYDEPDVNLHYEAQRRLYSNISDIAHDEESKTQCFVCTHSVFLIDRAPPESINLIRIGEDNNRNCHYIEHGIEEDIVDFFGEVGRAVGLTNTALLYEKGFLLVEGPSEKTALPQYYRLLFGDTHSRDGLRIINLQTCGAWRSVVRVLLANRKDMIHLLLDSDCTEPNSPAQLTLDVLDDLGCPPDFMENQVTLIGEKEYEDAFADDLYVETLNSVFPRSDGEDWEVSHIRALRENSDKFSDELKNTVLHETVKEKRSSANKPGIARAVAKHCTDTDRVPAAIVEAFQALRERAGITM